MSRPSQQALIQATSEAVRAVDAERFFATERGFHGRFYSALQAELARGGYITDGLILEMEHQKSARHGTRQRPDIVLHVPTEASGARPNENNVAVWALKRKATKTQATKDFSLLDDLFSQLHYNYGFFINIESEDPMLHYYTGKYVDRLQAVSVGWSQCQVCVQWAPAEVNKSS